MASRYWVGASGNWNDTSRWAEVSNGAGGFSIPTSADDVHLEKPVTVTVPSGYTAACKLLKAQNIAGSLVVTGTLEIYGDVWIQGASFLTQGAGQYVMKGTGAQSVYTSFFTPPNLTLNGVAVEFYNSPTQCGTLTVLSGTINTLTGLVCDSVSLQGGTLSLVGTCTIGSITTSTAAYKLLNLGSASNSAQITMTGANPFTIGVATNIAYYSSTVYIGGTTAHTVNIGSMAFYNLVLANPNAPAFRFTASVYAYSISASRSGNYTVQIDAGQTISTELWTVNGTAGNIVSLRCTTPGSRGNITKTGGGTVTTQYMSVKDINASPALTWLSLQSEDLGNNKNWYFDAFYKPNTLLFGSPM